MTVPGIWMLLTAANLTAPLRLTSFAFPVQYTYMYIMYLHDTHTYIHTCMYVMYTGSECVYEFKSQKGKVICTYMLAQSHRLGHQHTENVDTLCPNSNGTVCTYKQFIILF